MADGQLTTPEQKAQAAAQLSSARAKAAMEQSRLTQGAREPQREDIAQYNSDRFLQPAKRRYSSDAQDARVRESQGEDIGGLSRLGLGGKRRARDFIASKRAEEKRKKEEARHKDYPNPIRVWEFAIWGMFAIGQDVIPAVGDIIGIGWIINYFLLPITWVTYWAFIIRKSPYSLRRQFWLRSALISSVGWIPVVGEVLPEWIATWLGSMYVIYRYERGGSFSAIPGSVSEKANAISQKVQSPAKS